MKADPQRELLGAVNLDKPLGWSSAEAVTVIRRLLGGWHYRDLRVGHAGTLDPKATGVLVLLVGRATRLAELLMDAGKEYVADVRLGAVSTTDDMEGEITERGGEEERRGDAETPGRREEERGGEGERGRGGEEEGRGDPPSARQVAPATRRVRATETRRRGDEKTAGHGKRGLSAFSAGGEAASAHDDCASPGSVEAPTDAEKAECSLFPNEHPASSNLGIPVPSEELVRDVLRRFTGTIQQRPPAHSALKVDGKPAYRLARRGKPLDLAARPVRVDAIDVLEYAWPVLRLRIACGRGTYVRALARDIGAALGVGGYLAGLRRTRVGPFRVEEAVSPERCGSTGLAEIRPDNIADWLLPVERAAGFLPQVRLTDEQARQIAAGTVLTVERSRDAERLRSVTPDAGAASRAVPTFALPAGLDPRAENVAAFDPRGQLIALCRLTPESLRPTAVFRPMPARSAQGRSVAEIQQ